MATSKVSHTPLKTVRCVSASLVGGLFSLIILVPQLNYAVNLFLKLIASAVIITASFGIRTGFRNLLRLIMWFYAMNFIFAGIMLSLRYAFSLSFMRFSNSYFYMDFSLLSLVIFTAVSYAMICAVRYIIDRSSISNGIYRVIIKNNGKVISVEGIADTGNSLVDRFSGKPVIICSKQEIEKLVKVPEMSVFSEDYSVYCEYIRCLRNFRIIPYSTIGSGGIIPIFSPDEIYIKEEKSKKIKQTDAMIGISSENIKAVFNPKILN